MSLDGFWETVNAQLVELRKATTADEVLAVVSKERNPYGAGTGSGEGFFAGEGGEMLDAMMDAGWSPVHIEADYYWVARAPNGDLITYIEGDVERGNQMMP